MAESIKGDFRGLQSPLDHAELEILFLNFKPLTECGDGVLDYIIWFMFEFDTYEI